MTFCFVWDQRLKSKRPGTRALAAYKKKQSGQTQDDHSGVIDVHGKEKFGKVVIGCEIPVRKRLVFVWFVVCWLVLMRVVVPKQSIYGLFPYIYHKNQPNVGKYGIHGWCGVVVSQSPISSSPSLHSSSIQQKNRQSMWSMCVNFYSLFMKWKSIKSCDCMVWDLIHCRSENLRKNGCLIFLYWDADHLRNRFCMRLEKSMKQRGIRSKKSGRCSSHAYLLRQFSFFTTVGHPA